MNCGLDEETVGRIRAVFSNHAEVEKAILYGSRAKGTYNNGSDVDLTLQGTGLTLDVMNKISLELDDLLTPYTFDLSIFREISDPDLVSHIDRVGVAFYRRQDSQG